MAYRAAGCGVPFTCSMNNSILYPRQKKEKEDMCG